MVPNYGFELLKNTASPFFALFMNNDAKQKKVTLSLLDYLMCPLSFSPL